VTAQEAECNGILSRCIETSGTMNSNVAFTFGLKGESYHKDEKILWVFGHRDMKVWKAKKVAEKEHPELKHKSWIWIVHGIKIENHRKPLGKEESGNLDSTLSSLGIGHRTAVYPVQARVVKQKDLVSPDN